MGRGEGEQVGFAIGQQVADLVELASERFSQLSNQVTSLVWNVRRVLDGAPVDVGEPAAFEVVDSRAGQRAERAVEVAVDDELESLIN